MIHNEIGVKGSYYEATYLKILFKFSIRCCDALEAICPLEPVKELLIKVVSKHHLIQEEQYTYNNDHFSKSSEVSLDFS